MRFEMTLHAVYILSAYISPHEIPSTISTFKVILIALSWKKSCDISKSCIGMRMSHIISLGWVILHKTLSFLFNSLTLSKDSTPPISGLSRSTFSGFDNDLTMAGARWRSAIGSQLASRIDSYYALVWHFLDTVGAYVEASMHLGRHLKVVSYC